MLIEKVLKRRVSQNPIYVWRFYKKFPFGGRY